MREFKQTTNEGNGFTFANYSTSDFIYAVENAIRTYK